ncbi:outer membrane beta-barrel protein [Mesorhizobium australicum]|uniref:Outer membrane beta-barrel protein n=1 Tax=Mesorhizobium australicum TaxID=536018 RepID=A0A1X7PNG5_9HYPH|nr:outer membrane beta-barrel protein [Mesorhizobium australicum]SMH52448.1 hypothetical protein SAMN02982922_4675 [Mesorhizobium australicum]
MPRLRTPSSRLLRSRALLLSAGVVLVALAPAFSQEAGLRGEVTEADIRRDLVSRPSPLYPVTPPTPEEQRAANPAYVPEGPRATEEEAVPAETLSTLFSDAAGDAAALGEPEAAERPVGVRKRESETEAVPEEPAAEEEEPASANPRAEKVDSEDEERNIRIEPENVRTAGIESPEPEVEENPYAPLGLRLGTFNVITTLEQGLTWTSNATYSPQPKSALLSESTLRLNAASDWSRHSANINAYGTYRKSISGEPVTDPSAGIDATLNLDFADDLRGIGKLGYVLKREDADSPVEQPETVTSRPIRQEITGSLGLEKDVGKLRFAATANLLRLDYSDADLSEGGTLSQRERNSTLVTGVLRAGYEISPAITPFLELEYGRRSYDFTPEGGNHRSSDRMAARLGTELDLGEKLSGELALGYVTENFDDAALSDISGMSASADLSWSPQRGTTVGFNASTEVEGTTTANESGSVLYSGTVSLQREIRANLSANASLGLSWRDYASTPDHDLTWRGETSLTWWLNRYAGVTGRYRFEHLTSTKTESDTTVHNVFLGVTLQR